MESTDKHDNDGWLYFNAKFADSNHDFFFRPHSQIYYIRTRIKFILSPYVHKMWADHVPNQFSSARENEKRKKKVIIMSCMTLAVRQTNVWRWNGASIRRFSYYYYFISDRRTANPLQDRHMFVLSNGVNFAISASATVRQLNSSYKLPFFYPGKMLSAEFCVKKPVARLSTQ